MTRRRRRAPSFLPSMPSMPSVSNGSMTPLLIVGSVIMLAIWFANRNKTVPGAPIDAGFSWFAPETWISAAAEQVDSLSLAQQQAAQTTTQQIIQADQSIANVGLNASPLGFFKPVYDQGFTWGQEAVAWWNK